MEMEPQNGGPTDGMGVKDADGPLWTRFRKMDSAGCEMEDGNAQMRLRSKMRWNSGGADENVKMGLGVGPQVASK